VNGAFAAGGAWSIADPRHPLHGRRREDAQRRADGLLAQLAGERRRLEGMRRECDQRSGAATRKAEPPGGGAEGRLAPAQLLTGEERSLGRSSLFYFLLAHADFI
jgi:hypothetical protein